MNPCDTAGRDDSETTEEDLRNRVIQTINLAKIDSKQHERKKQMQKKNILPSVNIQIDTDASSASPKKKKSMFGRKTEKSKSSRSSELG